MRPRRAHPDARFLPGGRPEVELFTFWERDVTGEPEPAVAREEEPVPPSVAPLWCAGGLALVFLLVALLL